MQKDDRISELYIKIFFQWERRNDEWSVSNPMDEAEARQLAAELNQAFTAIALEGEKFRVCFNIKEYAKYGEAYGGNWRDLIVANANTPYAQKVHPTGPITTHKKVATIRQEASAKTLKSALKKKGSATPAKNVRFKDAPEDENERVPPDMERKYVREHPEKAMKRVTKEEPKERKEYSAEELAQRLSSSIKLTEKEEKPQLSDDDLRAAARFLKSEFAPPELRKPRDVVEGDHFKRKINISSKGQGNYRVLITFSDYEAPIPKNASFKASMLSNMTTLTLGHTDIMHMANVQRDIEEQSAEKTTPKNKHRP